MSRLGITIGSCVLVLTLSGVTSAQQLKLDSLQLSGDKLAATSLNVNRSLVDEPIQDRSVAAQAPARRLGWQEDDAVNWLVVTLLFVGFTFGLIVTVSSIRGNQVQPVRLL